MNISIKVSLGCATASKRRQLSSLLVRLRSLTNKYIASLWLNPGRLDKETMGRITCPELSYRHRSNCLKVALETVISTRKAAKETRTEASLPVLRGAMRLSSLVCKVEKGNGSFDYVLKVSGLSSGNPIVIPFRSHKRLNHWMAMPGAELLQGATVSETSACLWIKLLPTDLHTTGEVLGLDVGAIKLISDSNGNHYGREMRSLMDAVRRTVPGSNGNRRARTTRNRFINQICKQIPYANLMAIGIEDLKGIKHGKGNRGKQFRKWIAPWTVRQVHQRIEFLCQLNRVQLVHVNPRGTSRTCPMCSAEHKESRKGECFDCVACHYQQDADHVGAMNILARTLQALGSVSSPSPTKDKGRNVSV